MRLTVNDTSRSRVESDHAVQALQACISFIVIVERVRGWEAYEVVFPRRFHFLIRAREPAEVERLDSEEVCRFHDAVYLVQGFFGYDRAVECQQDSVRVQFLV